MRRSLNQHFTAAGLESPLKAPEGSALQRRVFPLFTLDTSSSHLDVSDVFVLVLDAVHAPWLWTPPLSFINGREIGVL